MRLAISNIAWPAEYEQAVADRLADFGVRGVEIAPTKVWPHPLDSSELEVRRYRDFWESRGLPIVAMQSLLFERPNLSIFANPSQRVEAAEYLRGMIRLGGRLGVHALVFGSPKNRRISPRLPAEVMREAIEFFRALGDAAVGAGTCLCIEPNPPQYVCDFVTNVADGIALVRAVDHPGVRLHLDSACMTLAGDRPKDLAAAADLLRHFHLSAENLGPLDASAIDFGTYSNALRTIGYSHWQSIEMKPPIGEFSVDAIGRACRRVTSVMVL